MLDIKEKLVEMICESINHDCVGHCNLSSPNNCLQCTCIADHLIANGVTIEQWISAEDELPKAVLKQKRGYYTYEKSDRLLLVCKQKSGKRMVKEGYCEFWGEERHPCWKVPGTIDDVTHWRPLPALPKIEDGDVRAPR